MAVFDYSTTASANTNVLGSIFTGPQMARSDTDNSFRQLMADIAALGLPRSVEQYGAVGDGSTNDAAAIQAACAAIVATGKRGVLVFAPGKTYKCLSGISIDASYVSVFSQGAKLDFSGMTTGTAITVTGSVDPPYKQSMNMLRLPEMIGPGSGSSVDGVLLSSTASGSQGFGPAHLTLQGLNVHDFRYGLIFRNRAYLCGVYDSDFYNCQYCVWQDDAEDGQENNRLLRCTLFNSAWAARLSTSKCDLNMDGCSLDTLERLFQIDSGTLWLTNCHVEVVGDNSYTDTPIVLSDEFSRLYIRGGSRRVTVGITRNYDYWASLASGALLVDEVDDALSDKSATGIFATGAGTLLRPGRIGGNETRDNCWIAHETKSRVPDPDFASLDANCLYVFNPNTRYVDSGTNAISVVGGELKATKATAATNVFQFAMVLPAEPGELIGGAITYRKPGSQAGTMTIDAAWGRMDPVSTGVVPNIPKQSAYASNSITVPSSAVTDTQVNFSPLSSHRAPSWANCWLLIFTLTDMAAGDVYFSAPNFERAG